jgi:ribonuclease D
MFAKNQQKHHIITESDLLEIVLAINQEKIVALDTEFTRTNTYFPIPSIIQGAIKIGGKKQKFIIDCQLSKIDLSSFFQLISDEKIKKILHSCAQDLQIFHGESKKLPRGIVDTQIMATFSGFGFNVGYSNLVENIFSKTISKEQQRSDWQRRPLSDKQLEYALLDVEFLHEIYEKFDEILAQKRRQSWLAEELENFVEKSLEKSPISLMKNFSFRRKNPQQVAQMQDLILWREEAAKANNVIRQYFLKDEDIENIVEMGDFFPKKYQKINNKMAAEIKAILQNSGQAKFDVEGNLFLDENGKKSFDLAKNLIVKIANAENLPAQFLTTSNDLKKLINYQDSFDKLICGWRHDLFGKDLKKIINS